ncbi:tetratricopeptide repeat protein [Ferruginibacter sp. SUN106]|uniref:tetratricopeptide repeat protein n=1 Tax=Ferruginibacter sp. SUN106 TaxID=2978348 RepID=UPI003D35A083
MAEKAKVVETVEVNETLERAKGFWAKFSKPIIYVGSAIILLVGGWYAYGYFVKAPNELKASELIFPAEKLFGKMAGVSSFTKDSVGLVLNGGVVEGEKLTGMLTIIKNYEGTPAGNRAQYITGACYLHLGEFDKAIKYLKEFDGNGAEQIQSAAYRMIGDAYAELKKNDEALNYYSKAVDAASSKDESTMFLALSRAALFCDATGKTKEAIGYFQQIKDEITPGFFRNNRIDFDADKYLAKLGVVK